MLRYLKIFFVLLRTGFARNTAYPGTFFIAIIAKMLRSSLVVVLFLAFFQHMRTFAGWSFPEILFLSATYLSLEFFGLATFHRNLSYYFPRSLKSGEFDFRLTKPVSVLFITSFEHVDWYDISSVLPIVVMWVMLFVRYDFSIVWWQVLEYVMFLGIGLSLFFSLLLFLTSTAFWTINTSGVGRFFEGFLRQTKYPMSIFSGPVGVFVRFIIPLAAFATLPSEIFFGRASFFYMFYVALFALCANVAALWFWRFALKRYSSASS